MSQLPIPHFFSPINVNKVWRVPYEERAKEAAEWACEHDLQPANEDQRKVWLMLVDVQNTFCLPDFELYVGGHSGTGAVDDCRRLTEFIYCNLNVITHITATMDTHQAMQIFHAIFLVDEQGEHPAPHTVVTAEDVHSGRWKFNPALAKHFEVTPEYGQERLEHYVDELEKRQKYELTIWPYHAMLGGIGHALVASVEEAIFFHSTARLSPPRFEVKGDRPFTEHYSVLGPEVEKGPKGEALGQHNHEFIGQLQRVDALIVAGQAKSHCVAWTISDFLEDIRQVDPNLAKKVYLLEDCTSPVVIPGVADYTEQADQAFTRFAEAGMQLVKSTSPLETWPGFHREI